MIAWLGLISSSVFRRGFTWACTSAPGANLRYSPAVTAKAHAESRMPSSIARGQLGDPRGEQVRGLSGVARTCVVPAGLERIIEHLLAVVGRELVQPFAAGRGADQPGVHMVVHQRVHACAGRVVDELPAPQFRDAAGDVEGTAERVDSLHRFDQPVVEQVDRVPEDREQTDQAPAWLAEIGERRPHEVLRDTGLGFQVFHQVGRIGMRLAEGEADQHRTAVGTLDQAIGDLGRQPRARQPPDQHARLIAGQAAEQNRIEASEMQSFAADREELPARGAREVFDESHGILLPVKQVHVVQADQRRGPADRIGDQVRLLVTRQRLLDLARLAQRRRFALAMRGQEGASRRMSASADEVIPGVTVSQQTG